MTILKGVPKILTPELIYALAKMGHGDEIVLGDANFPSESVASSTPFGIIRCDGVNIPELLEAILKLLPLDFAATPCYLMALMPEHEKACKQIRATVAAVFGQNMSSLRTQAGWKTPIWDDYRNITRAAKGHDVGFETIERFAFYERAKKAYAVVATGESALYANLILKKGVLNENRQEL